LILVVVRFENGWCDVVVSKTGVFIQVWPLERLGGDVRELRRLYLKTLFLPIFLLIFIKQK